MIVIYSWSTRRVRARVENTFARMKSWKILRDCRLKGDGVHYAMLGIARLHNAPSTDNRVRHAEAVHARFDLKNI